MYNYNYIMSMDITVVHAGVFKILKIFVEVVSTDTG